MLAEAKTKMIEILSRIGFDKIRQPLREEKQFNVLSEGGMLVQW